MAYSRSSAAQCVREWLKEYKSLSPSELGTYAATIRNQPELTGALNTILTDISVNNEVLEPICHQLFEFYRCQEEVELRRFTLDLVPTLLTAYLLAISRNNKKKCTSVEVLLLSIYNLEIVDENGKPLVRTFTIPTLAAPSIYHEPPSLASIALTESSLMRYYSDEPITVTTGPWPQVESVNAHNRMQVVSYIVSIYNAEIALLSAHSLQALCTMCSILSRSGFEHLGLRTGDEENERKSRGPQKSKHKGVGFLDEPRITLSADFLIECLTGMYFAIFNGHATSGLQALEHVHMRASYELYADVLLVTNAVRNSLQYNPSGQPEDGPMGIAIALSPTQTANPAFLKDAITNASFRTKRMPEDIEVREGSTGGEDPPHYDDVVDADPPSGRSSTSRSQLPKLQLSKPLKSIMKSGRSSSKSKDDAVATAKKSGILKDTSPRHSVSITGSLNNSFNGEIPGAMQIEVQRGGRSHVVDTIEMASSALDSNTLRQGSRHTTSFSDDYISSASAIHIGEKNHNNSGGGGGGAGGGGKQRSVSTSLSRGELNNGGSGEKAGEKVTGAGAANGNSNDSSNHSLNTHL